MYNPLLCDQPNEESHIKLPI